MNKKAKIGLGVLGAAAAGGALWVATNKNPPKKPKPKPIPECAHSISYPEKITATKGTDGLWHASLRVKPPNAPCWMSYYPVATDDKGAQGRGAAIIIYVE